MRLLDNPFHLLRVGPDANRDTIEERVEEKLDGEEGGQDWQMLGHQLLKPKERLKCEIGWFPGLTTEQTAEIMRAVADTSGEEFAVKVPSNRPLALVNTIMAHEHRQAGKLGKKRVSGVLLRLAQTWTRVDVEAVTQQINRDRKRGGWRAQATKEGVEGALTEHEQWITREVKAILNELPTSEMLETMRELAEKATNGGTQRAPEAIREWLRMYEAECGTYFREQRKSVEHIARNATLAAKQGDTQRAQKLVEHYCKALQSWDEVAQPMQLMHQGEGSIDEVTQAMFKNTRDLAITLHNKHGATGLSKRVVRMQQEVFKEAEGLADIARKDKETLDEMAG